MSEFTPSSGASPVSGAGEILRTARLAQGLDLDALAATIKVSPAKLDALENGRHELLPDANFTRALAMTVCRSLKIDPAPVLAALPAAKAIPLAPSRPALNQPFKESRGANLSFDSGDGFDIRSLLKLQWLAPILLLLASVAVYLLPDSILHWPHWTTPSAKPVAAEVVSAPEPSPAASSVALESASAPEVVPSQADAAADGQGAASAPPAVEALPTTQAAAAPEPAANPSTSDANAAPSSLVLSSREAAWVEVRDKSSVLLSRHLKEGERVELNGTPPFKLRLGNSAALDVLYRGEPVELASHTRNNVARFQLK